MDEDFVQALRSLNVDLLTVADVGMLHRSDEEQIDWARQNGRVIFSFNTRDFEWLHTTGGNGGFRPTADHRFGQTPLY